MTELEFTAGTSVLSRAAYTSFDERDRRKKIEDTEGNAWIPDYNSRGELVGYRKERPDTTPIPGYEWTYSYDAIGNRVQTEDQGDAADWQANALNQYTERDIPRVLFMRGSAATDAVITVNGTAAQREGKSFFGAFDAGTASATQVALKVEGRITGGGDADADRVAWHETSQFLPATPETFEYDADGNLTQDGRWEYTWDMENRLIKTESLPSLPDDLRVCVSNEYDYMGRRVKKTVFSGYSGGSYSNMNSITYVWDAYNIVAELCDAGFTNTYLWGLDLSGALQGAGGVGGLLAVHVADTNSLQPSAYYPSCDGNGNITDYFTTSNSIAAHREYDAFGQTIALTGSKKDDFTHWFSTKPFDEETGLVMYELRVYSPELGRWVSRDMIQERGGVNIYFFLRNNPILSIDFLGLNEIMVHVVGQGGRLLGYHPDLKAAAKKLNIKYKKRIDPKLERMQEDCVKCGIDDIYIYQGHAGRIGGVSPALAAYTGDMYNPEKPSYYYSERLTQWRADLYNLDSMLQDFSASEGMPSIVVLVGCEMGSDWQSKFTAAGVKLLVSSGGSANASVASASINILINGLASGKTIDEAIRNANEVISSYNQRVYEQMTPLQSTYGFGIFGGSTLSEILP